jgi:hypothetical protein
VFCTYADFVYSGHPSVEATLFSTQHRFSRGFLSVCSRPGVQLLPVLLTRNGEGIHALIEEAVVIEAPEGEAKSRLVSCLALQTISMLLESLIAKCPEQWLLLGTLLGEVTYDTVQVPAPA